MKRYVREVAMPLLLITILAVGTLYGASDVTAEDKGLAQQIQGTWTLVSIYNEQNGKKTEVFGPNPKGTMILTPDGRFSVILMNASLPKFASNIRTKGTTEENKAVVQGSIAFFGGYKVADEKEHVVNLRVEGSTFPNWDGQEQKRFMTVIGDEMNYTNPTPAVGGGTNYAVWKRAGGATGIAATGLKEGIEQKKNETIEKMEEKMMMEKMKGDMPKKLPGY